MKKALVLLAIFGVLFLGCDNGSTGNNNPQNGELLNAKALSVEFFTYAMNEISASKSVMSSMSRFMVVGNVYEFTIIKPVPQNSNGAANAFEEKTINITVLNQEPLGNNQIRFEVRRSDNDEKFKITFDKKGMYKIEGLSGAKDGYLNQIGDNSDGLDGVYVGFSDDIYPPHYDPYSFIIDGNVFIMSNTHRDGDLSEIDGIADNYFTFSIDPIKENTINIDFEQYIKKPTTGEWEIVDKPHHKGMIKTATFTRSGDLLTLKIIEEYSESSEYEVMIGAEFPSRRVPTN